MNVNKKTHKKNNRNRNSPEQFQQLIFVSSSSDKADMFLYLPAWTCKSTWKKKHKNKNKREKTTEESRIYIYIYIYIYIFGKGPRHT